MEKIENFINQLKSILENDNFNAEEDLVLIRTEKQAGDAQYSTPYTLIDLDYDISDVAECLKKLTIEEYSETLIDKDNHNPPLLFVFGKDINNRQVYIKLKIKGNESKYILCISFHYAKEKMTFPYA